MRRFDLCIIGTGSANTIPDRRFAEQQIAIVEQGTFGGTCLNVGCIPTKMYVYPADLARVPAEAARLGVDLQLRGVRWADIRDRIFGRVDERAARSEKRRRESENITVYSQPAHFVGPRRLDVGDGVVIEAERFVIGAGSRVVRPDIEGLEAVSVHTSDTVMRLDRLPTSMIIIGGGYVAAEFAHVFSAFGTRVTVINRSGRLLRSADLDVSQRFTDLMSRRLDLRLDTRVERVQAASGGGVTAHLAVSGTEDTVSAEVLLLATGRRPNGDRLGLPATGVEVDDEGFVIVDEHQQTTAAGIFALGDVCSHRMLKHVANHEAKIVQHNLLHPGSMISSDHRFVPQAVFSEPQIASVGLTEQQANEDGLRCVTAVRHYASTAYGWAMEDEDHFVKLLADPDTLLLRGAHIIGPQASSLIQPLVQAMSFGQRADEVATGQYWIHPAMAEVVENALLDLSTGRS